MRKTATNHAIVCGYGHLGSRIAGLLAARGYVVTAIEKTVDSGKSSRAEAAGVTLIAGDARDESVLTAAGIATTCCIVAATGDDVANLEAAIIARQHNTTATIVLRFFDQELARQVEKAFDVNALSASFLAAPSFVAAATDDSIVSVIDVDGYNLYLYRANALPLGMRKGTAVLQVQDDTLTVLDAERTELPEHCLLASTHNIRRRSRKRAASRSTADWYGLLSRLNPLTWSHGLRAAWRQSTAVTRGLLSALLVVMAISIYVFAVFGRLGLLDAFYFVVTTLTTTGYGDINLQQAPPMLKMFGIVMMICGAALLATLYAIIADRMLAARLEYLLGRHPIKLRGHTIVVGLGNIGYRVAHDLHRLGIPVVAVEANEDLDNVQAARALFPVVIGDASSSIVMERTGLAAAETILLLTDDAILNLRIALHARERNAGIKIIMRTFDVELADKLKSLGLFTVISTSAIAAPAFVDAAVDPSVYGSFNFDGDDILVARHHLTAKSPLCGKSIRQLSRELGVAVVLAAPDKEALFRPVTPDTVLQAGQKIAMLLTREKIGVLEDTVKAARA